MIWRYDNHPDFVGPMVRMYKRALAHLKADPENTVQIRRWPPNPMNLAEFRQDFIGALDRRINLKVEGGDKPRGAKDDADWQWGARRDARRLQDIRTTRLRVYQFETKEARERFGHLLADRSED